MSKRQSLKQPLMGDLFSQPAETSLAESTLPTRNSLFSPATNPMPREGAISTGGSRKKKRGADPSVRDESGSDVGMHAGDCCMVFGEMLVSSTLGACTIS